LATADSITLDGHKWLQCPYDCGIFVCNSLHLLTAVCGPGANVPAYLSNTLVAECTTDDPMDQLKAQSAALPSPLFVSIENSRRLRALPLFASVLSLGRRGYQEIISGNIEFARRVEQWIRSTEDYDVLTPLPSANFKIMNIVLFAPAPACPNLSFRGDEGARRCVAAINVTGKMYVTGTVYKGRAGIRLAVSNVRHSF